MHTNALIVALLIAFLILMAVARQLRVAPPVALVLGGLALGFVPGLPRTALDPDLVLLAFLPPLLFWEASIASWRDIKRNLRPISFLAIGLVLVTMAVVATTAHALIPGMPWAVAFVLGAVVSPTDPVALLAIARRVPLPGRVVDVLVGESLVNDATALLAFKFALAAAATGTFLWAEASGRFIYVVGGGIAVGLACATTILRLRRVLAWDSLHDNLIVFIAPFLAYVVAEACQASAVLAVVVAGLYIGRRTPVFMTSETRLQGGAMWEMTVFVLNGLLFVLVGLQLQPILQQPSAVHWSVLLGAGAAITASVIATRIACVFPIVVLPRLLSARVRAQDPMPPTSHIWLLGWTGMRGGVSLAAALAIPLSLPTGAPFPGRNEIVFVTYMVILGTLGLQGLTLPLLIRKLRLAGDETREREEARARLALARAALARLDELAIARPIPPDIFETLRARLHERIDRLSARRDLAPDLDLEARDVLLADLRSEVLEAERLALVRMRDGGAIGDAILHRLQAELDHEVVQVGGPHQPG